MFEPDQYALLDFGDGRKLERFGEYLLDRPSPAAEGFSRRQPGLWKSAHARFQRQSGGGRAQAGWMIEQEVPASWRIQHGRVLFELKLTEFGHLGIFAEQASNWDWIERCLQGAGPVRVLNLFAYTGGSTLAAAAAGAQVTHVDAAANTVAWARRNAAISGLADAPIRWIVEDASKFAQRELRRGSRYQAVILDPPTFGHGPGGAMWKLEDRLAELLELCLDLTESDRSFLLLTCHSPGFTPELLEGMLKPRLPSHGKLTSSWLTIPSLGGGELPSGMMVRWSDAAC